MTDGTKTLAKGTDYTVAYTGNINVGTATATITGTGNYSGTKNQTFKIVAKSVADVSIAVSGTYTYNGSAITPSASSITVKDGSKILVNGTDYTYTFSNNTNAGNATITVTGKGNYSNATSKNGTFTIDQATITSVEIDQTQFVYDPTQERVVNVTKVMAGTLVVPVGSYEIVGNSNKATAIGTHTVTVQGKAGSNFKGTASTTFTITERMVYIDFGGRTFRTFYDANEPFLVPDDVTAYIITGVSGNTVTTKKVSYIQAGVPVLLESTPGTTNVADPAESFDGNLLKYAAPSGTAGDKHYILYNDEFVRATGLINGKVFLDLSDYGARARAYVINTDEATAVDGLFIEEDDGDAKWYDMQGRRINKPTKSGVYIKDGKKVVVKTRY